MSKRIPKTIISFEHNYYLDEDVFKMVNKLEQENKQLKSILTELEEYWENQQEHYRYIKDNRYRTFLSKNLNKIQKLKEKYK